jgi:hypothetical protein
MTSTAALALHYGLRLDAAPEFVRGYVDGMRLDQRGQGVACGKGWIPRSKKCSSDKAKQTSKEAKARTVEKAKERAKLKGEVNAAKGQKPYIKPKQEEQPLTGEEKAKKLASMRMRTKEEFEAFEALEKTLTPDEKKLYREERKRIRDEENKAIRSKRAKKGAEKRKAKKQAESDRERELNRTPEGKALLDAEARLAKTTKGRVLLDPKGFDKALKAKQESEDFLKVRNAKDNPSPEQRQYDNDQPDTDLNAGKESTRSYRVIGADRIVAGNRMSASESTGVPWSVDNVFGEPMVVASARILPTNSWDKTRRIELEGTDGRRLTVPFPRGNADISRRARRLVHEIGQGKSRSDLGLSDLQAFIQGDEVLQQRRQKQSAIREYDEKEKRAFEQYAIKVAGSKEDWEKKDPLAKSYHYLRFSEEFRGSNDFPQTEQDYLGQYIL